MPNFKVNYEEKLEAVQEYLDGNTTQMAMAKKYNISLASFQKWVRKYKAEGADGLCPFATYKKYSMEVKYYAVNDYLSGVGSLEQICLKYKISGQTTLHNWNLVF